MTGGVFVRDQHGRLTGKLFENPAIWRVLYAVPPATREQLRQAVIEQCKDYASRGFTTVTELSCRPDKDVDNILAEDAEKCSVHLAGLSRPSSAICKQELRER